MLIRVYPWFINQIMTKKKIYKPKQISGFPEWLPEERYIELQWLDKIRQIFESYGYCSIETPAVEELEVIAAKGEDVDKEIYVLERLHKEEGDKDARLALHFDQTVPLARYTAQHFNDLTFPFKRYQMQKVWRGERPQMGRMREFYQCDIDVINPDHLPIHFDGEVASICYEALAALDIGRVQLRISNRKILLGYVEAKNLNGQSRSILGAIDKFEKIGQEAVANLLKEDGLDTHTIEEILSLVTASEIKSITPLNETMREGIEELYFVLDQLSHLPDHAVKADLSIVRGLDYYTGTVYETQLLDVPEFSGSVCSGGRYDDLAGSYINKHLPGVGISIGFSRLFDVMRQSGKLPQGQKSPAQILVLLPNEDRRGEAAKTAQALRTRGFKVEQYHAPQKLGKQFSYAEKKGIPYVWIPPFEEGQDHEVKNMTTGEQSKTDIESFEIQ